MKFRLKYLAYLSNIYSTKVKPNKKNNFSQVLNISFGHLVIFIFLFLIASPKALAATFTVTNTNDSGAGSLRNAVAQAEANPGADTIVFSAGLAGQTITLTSKDSNIRSINNSCSTFNGNYTPYGALQITETLTVDGSNAPGINLSGNWNGTDKSTQGNRIFYVPSPNNRPTDRNRTAAVFLNLNDVSLDKGNAGPLNGGGDPNNPCSNGGNIYVDSPGGELNLTRVTIKGGHANDGGGINVERGDLNISNSTLSENLTRDDGGAIDFSGTGTANLVNSTIGYNRSGFGSAGNTSNRGGAVRLDSVMNMTYVTVAYNQSGGDGGFIENRGTLNVRNSLLVDNISNATGNIQHCKGNVNNLGGNWESVSNAGDSPTCNGFNTDTEPKIQLSVNLADNNGTTKTLALNPSSSVNRIIPTSDNLCPEGVGVSDQRYFPRAVGAGCEPGAMVEMTG